MNAALLRRALRDTWLLALLMTAGIMLFEMFFIWAIGEFAADIQQVWFSRQFLRNILQMALGADLADNATPTAISTVGLVHPLLYTLTWALLLTIGTRLVAEVERGTADLLLTLPVSRTQVYSNATLAWLVWSLPMSAAPIVGIWIGAQVNPLSEPLDYPRLALAAVNLFALYIALGGLITLASACLGRTTEVIATILTILLISFLINFLVQFWKPVQYIDWLSLLHYYKPLPIVRTGELPAASLAVLLGLGTTAWLIGWWRFARRDIPAP